MAERIGRVEKMLGSGDKAPTEKEPHAEIVRWALPS